MENNDIYIVLASDEGYVAHLATNIVSICENNKDAIIKIFILDGGILSESRIRLDSLVERYNNLQIEYYHIDDQFIVDRIGLQDIDNDRSLTTYARIFIPELLPESVDRCVYLDADGIVEESLAELMSLPIKNEIAGVQDINRPQKRIAVGLTPTDNYICAGVILFDLKKCRENFFTERCLDFIRTHNGSVTAMDQGTINGVMRGKVDLLDPRFNVMTPFYKLSEKELSMMGGLELYYTSQLLEEAINHPVFIHFTPAYTTRPWQVNCRHPQKDRYEYYRNKTGFTMNELMPDKRKVSLKILSFLYWHIPFRLFNLITLKL